MIGDHPEAAEAALIAAYPGRDPLAEVMVGDITVRKFRVLVENLPAGNALEAARHGGWSRAEWHLWHAESRFRELVALTYNLNRGDHPAMSVEYRDRPKSDAEVEQEARQAAYDARMTAEMDRFFEGR